jgi:peptide/nickel transport system ATP-binding protein
VGSTALAIEPPLLEIIHLKKYFLVGNWRKEKDLKAVDDVSLEISHNEITAIVGESGCGKTTLARTVIKFYEPTSGIIRFRGEDITHLKEKKMRSFRRRMQIVFQNPYSSLNPRKIVSDIISAPLKAFEMSRDKTVIGELLDRVGLDSTFASRYPHELSGGQRQRVAIARAIALTPNLIVADEITASLDVSVQAQILNLLMDLHENYRINYLMISHDLSIVKNMAQKIAVMYLGAIVEEGDVGQVYNNPLHPYTKALLSAIPRLDSEITKVTLHGEPTSAAEIPTGCRFQTRCPFVMERCKLENPLLIEKNSGHKVACFLY